MTFNARKRDTWSEVGVLWHDAEVKRGDVTYATVVPEIVDREKFEAVVGPDAILKMLNGSNSLKVAVQEMGRTAGEKKLGIGYVMERTYGWMTGARTRALGPKHFYPDNTPWYGDDEAQFRRDTAAWYVDRGVAGDVAQQLANSAKW